MSVQADIDLYVRKGDTLNSEEARITLLDSAGDPIDLSGYTITGQIRDAENSSGNLIASFTVAPVTDYTDGAFDLGLAASVTEDLTAGAVYYFDLKFVTGSVVKRWVKGTLRVEDRITE